MNIFKKSTAIALTVFTLGTAALASGAEARPRHWGWGGAAAVAGGLALGGIIAASNRAYAEPVYGEDAPVRRCFTVERFNRYGEVIGERRVCRSAY